MWAELVDAVREVTAAHPTTAADVVAIGVCSQYSSIVPVDEHGPPVAPMLMWQDQRGTDHSFEIMAPRRERVHDVRRAPRHPADRQRPLARPHPPPPARPARRARAHRRVPRGDGLRHRAAAPAGSPRRSTARSWSSCCDNRDARRDRVRRRARRSWPASTRRACRRSFAVDAAIGTLLPDVADGARPARDRRPCTRGTNDTATVAVATGAFAPGRAGLAIGTTSVLVDAVADFRVDLEHQIFSMPGPYVDRYVVCAENGLGGKVARARARRTSCTPPTSSATTASTTRSPRSTRRSPRPSRAPAA